MERAAEADGIPVNTVHPVVIDTPIWTKLSGSGGRNVPIDPNEVAIPAVPLGRGWTGGAELVIDGGMTGARDVGGAPEAQLQQRPQSASLAESSIVIYLWKIPLKSHYPRSASR